ncbi:unnamed protein product [Penicillium manginii]
MGQRDAPCLTCRQKAHKFRFCGIASRGKWKNQDLPISKDSVSTSTTDSTATEPTISQGLEFNSWVPPSQNKASSSVTTPEGNIGTPGHQEHSKILVSKEAETLLVHYDRIICPHQIAQPSDKKENPYRLYVIPLAYEQLNVLYAVLGLSACHMGHLNSEMHLYESVAVEYRAKAINALGTTINKVCSGNFRGSDVDSVFATIQILLLHDICETGISSHGAHISGAMSICSQLKLDQTLTVDQERTVFFLGNLLWLDIIRAFSAPERLCFTHELRSKILSLCNLRFESVNGCPREIVLIIATILEYAKQYAAGSMEHSEFHDTIHSSIRKLYLWDSSRCFFPDNDVLWGSVSNAFRHACILRAWRLLDPSESASEPKIRDSVFEILDSVANIPSTSPLLELMVLPLFMAGADNLSAHSRHYVILRLEQIKARSEMGNTAPQALLEKVWTARAEQPKHDNSNIPWMSFTFNSDSSHQDDYLII